MVAIVGVSVAARNLLNRATSNDFAIAIIATEDAVKEVEYVATKRVGAADNFRGTGAHGAIIATDYLAKILRTLIAASACHTIGVTFNSATSNDNFTVTREESDACAGIGGGCDGATSEVISGINVVMIDAICGTGFC